MRASVATVRRDRAVDDGGSSQSIAHCDAPVPALEREPPPVTRSGMHMRTLAARSNAEVGIADGKAGVRRQGRSRRHNHGSGGAVYTLLGTNIASAKICEIVCVSVSVNRKLEA